MARKLRIDSAVRLLLLGLIIGLYATSLATAQSDPEKELAQWALMAKQAETAITLGQATMPELEKLRTELAAQRTHILDQLQQGNIETRTLRAQLELLGPPPPEGQTEAATLADSRLKLTNAIAVADAPMLATRQAHKRADILIAELNKLIRRAVTAQWLERAPTPLRPSGWITAVTELSDFLTTGAHTLRQIYGSPDGYHLLHQQGLLAIGCIVAAAGCALFLRPRLWRRLDSGLPGEISRGQQWLHTARAIFLRLLVPATEAILIAISLIMLTSILPNSRLIRSVVLSFLAFLVGASWLGQLLFAPTAPKRRIVQLDGPHAQTAARISLILGGLLLALELVLESVEHAYTFSPPALSVLAAVVVAAGSICLWILAGQLKPKAALATPASEGGKEKAPNTNLRRIVVRLIQVMALAAITCAMVGFVQLARQVMVPMILSLGLFGLSLAVQHGIVATVRLITVGNTTIDPNAFTLLPVFSALLLLVVTLPLHALIWGARVAEISEIWVLLNEGIDIGGTRFSLRTAALLLATFSLCYMITRWLQKFLQTEILPKTKLDPGGQNAVLTGFGYTGILGSALIAISVAGLNLANLAIVAGALSVGIGFGLQAIVSNFISGIILLIERPVKEGDWIEVGGHSGIVRKISVRSTRIETFDSHEVIIPNADLVTGSVTNMTLHSRAGRIIIPLGVAYGSDVEQTKQILLEVASQHPMTLVHPPPVVLFTGLGDSALEFELRCFIRDITGKPLVISDLLTEIYTELNQAGIEIPFPQRAVTLGNIDEIAQALASQAGRDKIL